MDAWNRDQLYVEVWEQPASKVAVKYGVSGVMIGKICRKLKIPLPGRGYWAKKEFGKPVERMPFLEEKDLPVLMRHTFPAAEQPYTIRSYFSYFFYACNSCEDWQHGR